ncbi:MAG: YafY family protein [Enterococcus faecalis]|nr:YafY family protein [Enterococcus faecalis]MDU5126580.1 YafY family protein [Enterococcus faecalis]
MEGKMKKSERLNQELFFLRTHPQFNLNQLMKTFGISKSTALRDIEALEHLGVPLYVENGRYGGYRVLNKPLLPPIYFNENEVLAIFFSLQLLKLVAESPFGHSYQQIKQKLLHSLDEPTQFKISQMSKVVYYEGIEQVEAPGNLEQLFHCILAQQVIQFNYTRYEETTKKILPTRLTFLEGYWYCSGYDVTKKAWRTYRCDFMEAIQQLNQTLDFTTEELKESYRHQQTTARTIPFKAIITEKGKEFFYKHRFDNIQLEETPTQCFLVGQIHPTETQFLANYFMGFGEEVTILEPVQVKQAYVESIMRIQKKYQE